MSADNADSQQTVQVTAKAPKWVLPALLGLSGVAVGAGTTRLSADGMAEIASAPAAEAAARKVLREVDPPTKAEVRQLAREESQIVAAAAQAALQRWLDERFARTDDALATLRAQAADNAQTLRQIDALLRAKGKR